METSKLMTPLFYGGNFNSMVETLPGRWNIF